MKALGLKTNLEDMILTLGDQIHFIKIVSPTLFVYLAVERAVCNIAIVRNVIGKHAKHIGWIEMGRQIDFDGSMNQALDAYREAAAVACVDARTGMLLGASMRGANFEDVLEHASHRRIELVHRTFFAR